MNLNLLWLTLVQFVASLNLPKFHAPRKGAVRMRSAPLVVFSLVLLTTIAVSVTSNGANAGSSRECLGIKEEQNQRQTGILKSNYEISNADRAFLAAEETASATTRFVSTENGIVDVQPTLNRIESGGSFPHPNDGSVFQNRPVFGNTVPELPLQPSGYYNEYVVPTPGVNNAGLMRIVTGQGGELYFTPNHYQTFVPLNP